MFDSSHVPTTSTALVMQASPLLSSCGFDLSFHPNEEFHSRRLPGAMVVTPSHFLEFDYMYGYLSFFDVPRFRCMCTNCNESQVQAVFTIVTARPLLIELSAEVTVAVAAPSTVVLLEKEAFTVRALLSKGGF